MLIDDNWYHIGSVGYNDNFVSKKDYCLSLSKLIDSGIEWDELVVSQRTAQ
jgi:hypothetical protein